MSLTQTVTTNGLQLRTRKWQLPAAVELGAKMKVGLGEAQARRGASGGEGAGVRVQGTEAREAAEQEHVSRLEKLAMVALINCAVARVDVATHPLRYFSNCVHCGWYEKI
jgi:hypothetical protein